MDSMTGPSDTRNPVAIVTGASRGLGRVLAGFLAKQGHALIVTARGEAALRAAAKEFAATGADVISIPADVPGRVPGPGHLGPSAPGCDPAVLGVAPLPGTDAREWDAVPGPGRGVGGLRMRRTDLVFERPERTFAREPPEVRGRSRDDVR